MNLVNKILRYLKYDPEKGILMQKNGNLKIVRHKNTDWTRCSIDRHSTTGYYTTIGGNLMT